MKKFISIAIALMLIASMVISGFSVAAADTEVVDKEVEILFTHDMHSHLEKFPKIKTIIDSSKDDGSDPFVFDAGDFSMGTPFQTIYKDDASELRMMGFVGFDAVTFGNHEFDYRSQGLSQMLDVAVSSGDRLPQIVAGNIDFDKTIADPELAEDGKKLKKAMKNAGVKPYTVIEKNGVKVAVFGIFGKESASYAPESGTYFKDPVESAEKIVKEIEKNEDADLVVCVSHSGTNFDDPEKSEDEIIAKSVDGIDLIISGHSHTELSQPIVHNDTYVVSCGQYNDNIGAIKFKIREGSPVFDDYSLIPLDEKISDDETSAFKIAEFKKLADSHYFSQFGYSWDQVIAQNNIDFTPIDEFGLVQGEDTLGNLISDSYIYGIKQAEGENYEPIALSVVPSGVIRGSIDKGDVTVAEVFNILSLGIGKDKVPGYPLVSVYLTGKEIKLAAEIDISISEIMSPARLYCSGITYRFNPNRLILNKAYDVNFMNSDGDVTEIEDDKLYRVCADLYSAQMLGTVNSMSKGLLSVVPKDKDGNEIKDFEEQIVYDKNGNEVKEWHALASYIDSFEGNQIPERYAVTENRKIMEDDDSLSAFFRNPNKYFWMIIGAILAVILIIVIVIFAVVKLIRKIKQKRTEKH